jgi:hypothetical protein
VQSWPALISDPATAPRAAASMSASSNTTNGAFPPSSRWTRLTRPAANEPTRLPAPVEPVKETVLTSRWHVEVRREPDRLAGLAALGRRELVGDRVELGGEPQHRRRWRGW